MRQRLDQGACTSCTPSTLAARHPRFQGHHGIAEVSLPMVYNIETTVDLAGLPCQSWSSTYAPTRTTSASSAAPVTRLLSDQLSDYRPDDPYIQAHLHGLSSRSALDLDDSPTLRSGQRSHRCRRCHSEQLSNHLTRINVGGKHVVNQPETTPTPSPVVRPIDPRLRATRGIGSVRCEYGVESPVRSS